MKQQTEDNGKHWWRAPSCIAWTKLRCKVKGENYYPLFHCIQQQPRQTYWIIRSNSKKPVTFQITIGRNVHLWSLLGSATQSNSTDPLGDYNTCLHRASCLTAMPLFVTRTVTDRTSAPWMTVEIKQAKSTATSSRRKMARVWFDCTHGYLCRQRNLASDMISKAKKAYLCRKIVNCGSSRELFRFSSKMMGKFGDTMIPSNISPEPLPDKFNDFFVHKTEGIRSSFVHGRPIPNNPVEFSVTVFAEF